MTRKYKIIKKSLISHKVGVLSSLLLVLVVLSGGYGRVSAAPVTVNIGPDTIIDSTASSVIDLGGGTLLDAGIQFGIDPLPGQTFVETRPHLTENNGFIGRRGYVAWDTSCSAAPMISLRITAEMNYIGDIAVSNEATGFILATINQTPLVIDTLYDGYEFNGVLARGYALSSNNVGSIGMLDASFETTGYTIGDLPDLLVTNMLSTDNTNGSSMTMTAPTITVTYDDSQCTPSTPVATPEATTTQPGKPVTYNVLPNDSDPENDTLTVTSANITSGDTLGSVSFTADGNITYTPSAGFTGTTVITYTISDGNGGTASSTLSITITTGVPNTGIGASGSSNVLLVTIVVTALSVSVLSRKYVTNNK